MRSREEAYIKLIEDIKERNGKPVNANVVAATIESLGIRDVDVQTDYGYDSIIHLANKIYGLLSGPDYRDLKNKYQLRAEKKNYKRINVSAYINVENKKFIKNYSIGLMHLFPVFIQVLAIILFGMSLWTFIGFNSLQSTAVVLGVILGLITSGGFVQVIGKQVSFYWYTENYPLTYKSTFILLRTGMISIITFFVALGIINSFLHLYPFQFLLIVFIYAMLIGILLLVLAPLYTIKQRWMISFAVFTGTAIALFMFLTLDIHVYAIHWTGIIISILISLSYTWYYLKRIIRKNQKKSGTGTPKKLVPVYSNFIYFFYGIFLYTFIFIDRLVAWSTTFSRDLPYIVYYEKNYEIGMDLAILAFFSMAGVMEYSIASFTRIMDLKQRTTSYSEREKFNREMFKLYRRHINIFAVSSVVAAIFLYLLITQPWGYSAGFEENLSSLSIKISIIGGLGYFLLAFAMMNVLYLFTLNQPKKALTALGIAAVVNILVGVLCSRMISYEYSVVGFTVGAVVFAWLTTRYTTIFFKKLDYFYYAAY